MGRKKAKKTVSPNHNGTRPKVKGYLDQMLEDLETSLITKALDRNAGSVRATAIELGCNRMGLYKRMDRLGINVDEYKPLESS